METEVTDRKSLTLGIIIASVCAVQALAAAVTCCFATYFALFVQANASLLEGYDGSMVCQVMIYLTLVSVKSHGLGGKLCYDASRKSTGNRFKGWILPWMIITLILCIIEISVALASGYHYIFHTDTYRLGFMKAINYTYMTDRSVQEQIDNIQVHYSCCGADNYTDWLYADWTPKAYNPIVADENRYNDYQKFYQDANNRRLSARQLLVTPWSCCAIEYEDLCLHDYTSQYSFSHAFAAYTWMNGVGLNPIGCAKIIQDLYDTNLFYAAIVFCVMGASEIVVAILAYSLVSSLDTVALQELEEEVNDAIEMGNLRPDSGRGGGFGGGGFSSGSGYESEGSRAHKGGEGDHSRHKGHHGKSKVGSIRKLNKKSHHPQKAGKQKPRTKSRSPKPKKSKRLKSKSPSKVKSMKRTKRANNKSRPRRKR